MKNFFLRGRKAAAALFWDECRPQGFRERKTDWGERIHEREQGGEGFPCRLTERPKAAAQRGMLTETEGEYKLLYPADRDIPPGSALTIRRADGTEQSFFAAGESRCFLTHRETGLRRRETI